MARSHIALMAVPLHGHVNPLLGVAAELVARGHRVTFATGGDFTTVIEETGAVAVGYDTTFPRAADGSRSWLPADDDGRAAVRAFRRERDNALPQVAALYVDNHPDVVVHDTVTGHAPVLAGRWGVPVVRFSPTHALPATWDDGPCIVAMPRSLQVDADRVAEGTVFVGPVTWRRGVDGSWTRPPQARRVALVSLGTTYNRRTEIFRWCVEALAAEPGWHVVVATGGATGHGIATGPQVEVHPWIPQQDVLVHADVLVTAGGTGTVLEGLAHGVPLVVLPQGVEQFLTAHRVQELGLGRCVSGPELGADTVRRAVSAVVGDAATAQRSAAIRMEIAAAGGARTAADVIEARLARALNRDCTDRQETHR